MTIPVTVIGQKMFLDTGQHRYAPGTQRFIKYQFNLSNDWEELTVFAQWKQNGHAYNQYLDVENCAYLPREIAPGSCTMMLYGTGSGDVIAMTDTVTLCITNDMFVENADSTVITRTLYDQLVDEVSQYIPFSQVATVEEVKAALDIA